MSLDESVSNSAKVADTSPFLHATRGSSDAYNTSYSSEYKDINVAMTNTNYVIGKDEKVVLKIEATKNSLYCQSIKIVYE